MILSIDTASDACSTALVSDHTVIAERFETRIHGHAERLMVMMTEMLETEGHAFSAVTEVVATAGPGGFTGIRVGLATARGLALALSCPCYGVGTLPVLAFGARLTAVGAAPAVDGPPAIAAILDSRRNDVFMQIFESSGAPAGPASAMPIARAAEVIDSVRPLILCGNRAREVFDQLSDGDDVTIAEEADLPRASWCGLLASGSDRDRWVHRPSPIYLRAPDATPAVPGIRVADG